MKPYTNGNQDATKKSPSQSGAQPIPSSESVGGKSAHSSELGAGKEHTQGVSVEGSLGNNPENQLILVNPGWLVFRTQPTTNRGTITITRTRITQKGLVLLRKAIMADTDTAAIAA